MSKGIDQVMWIWNILDELKISYIKPIDIWCDNKSAISIAHDPIYHDGMKHVNIDRFYIQDHLEQGILKTDHVPSEEGCADIFTKGLPMKASNFQAWNEQYTFQSLRGSVDYWYSGPYWAYVL